MTDKKSTPKSPQAFGGMQIHIEEYISFLEMALYISCGEIEKRSPLYLPPEIGAEFYGCPVDGNPFVEYLVDYLSDHIDTCYSAINPKESKERYPIFAGLIFVNLPKFLDYKELVEKETKKDGMPCANGIANDFLNENILIWTKYANFLDLFADEASYIELRKNALEPYKYFLKEQPNIIKDYEKRANTLKQRCENITPSIKQTSIFYITKEEVENHLCVFGDSKYHSQIALNDRQVVILCSYLLSELGYNSEGDNKHNKLSTTNLARFIATLTGKNAETIRKVVEEVRNKGEMGYSSSENKMSSLNTIKQVIANIEPNSGEKRFYEIGQDLAKGLDDYKMI